MIGEIVSHYRVIEKLGEGGMGMVYKAEDLKLKRLVALKFISPVLTRDKEANERFIYEAQTASSLDHQNIATIYEIDDCEDGRMFISMAYYPGETLNEKISREQIGKQDAVDIAVQLAEGLAKAHRKGIMHKDIKPANVLIDNEGNVKIIDFGLAELLTTYNISKPGGTMGTVAYMAPEQIAGKMVDYRADIWALGVIIYEMLTGVRPFQGKYDQEIIYAILNENPEPVSNLMTEADEQMEQIVNKALVKNPDKRCADMDSITAALKTYNNVISFGRHAALGKEHQRSPEDKQIKSLAVLPLANLSKDPEQEYFTDGMTDALITDLAKISSLKVISRTSVMRYKSTDKSLPEIAAELNVDAVVEGSVLRIYNRIQVNVQLIHAATDNHLWAETYKRDMQDVLNLQGELVQAIAKEISATITQQERKRFSWFRPVNPEPYDNYLKGIFHYNKMSPEHLDKALEYFNAALDKDPDFALAYAGIAGVWFTRTYWEVSPPKDSIKKAKASVSRALELDDTLEEAHCTLAALKCYYDLDWAGAEREFRKAIQLNPNYAQARIYYSTFLQAMKRDEEATHEVNRGMELDPINYFTQSFYVGNLLHLRKYDEAILKLKKILITEPNFPIAHRFLWICYHQKQMYDEAIESACDYFDAAGQNEISGILRLGYKDNGYQGVLYLAAEEMSGSSRQSDIRPIWFARLYAYAGKKNHALKWLWKSFNELDPLMINIGVSRDWDNLRDEPKFIDLMQKMNFPFEKK